MQLLTYVDRMCFVLLVMLLLSFNNLLNNLSVVTVNLVFIERT